MAFIVLGLSIELAEAVQPLLGRIKARDKNLEDQIRRAVESCPPRWRGYPNRVQAFELPRVPLHEDDQGVIRVVGSRVTLDSVVAVFDRGATPEEVVQSFPSLGLGDVYAILAWVVVRRADVDAYLARRAIDEQETRADVERRFGTAGLREKLLARRGSQPA